MCVFMSYNEHLSHQWMSSNGMTNPVGTIFCSPKLIVKPLFTVFPLSVDQVNAWLDGRVTDYELLLTVDVLAPLPCPALLMLRMDGHAAGLRAWLAWLSAWGGTFAGVACRTRQPGIKRLFARFGGECRAVEADGQERWWAPAEPFVTRRS